MVSQDSSSFDGNFRLPPGLAGHTAVSGWCSSETDAASLDASEAESSDCPT